MTEPNETALVLGNGTLPSARSIAAQLKAQLNGAVAAERARRGAVALPEDTYPMHRALARVIETCGEYSRAFGTAAKEARTVAEEELIDAVGEQDGVPNQPMTVPDPDGDIKVGLDTQNVYAMDLEALFSAVAFEVISILEPKELLPPGADAMMIESLEAGFADALVLGMTRLTELGKFEPQITKVRAFTKTLARMSEADGVAASVTSTIRKRSIYKGVKVERSDPK